jgi:hypothetical protein
MSNKDRTLGDSNHFRIRMTFKEKRLYHQIHPVKLFTDVITAFVSTYLCWMHTLYTAIVVAVVPSVIASYVLIETVNLDRYASSAFGRYMKKYMDTRLIDVLRLSGFMTMVFGGWYHHFSLIVLGFAGIAACWTRGLVVHN